jgi:hypothetical protein
MNRIQRTACCIGCGSAILCTNCGSQTYCGCIAPNQHCVNTNCRCHDEKQRKFGAWLENYTT